MQLLQSQYGVIAKLHNSWFYDIDRTALNIRSERSDNTILVENCTFKHIQHNQYYYYQMIAGLIPNMNTLSFKNCKFNSSMYRYSLSCRHTHSSYRWVMCQSYKHQYCKAVILQ